MSRRRTATAPLHVVQDDPGPGVEATAATDDILVIGDLVVRPAALRRVVRHAVSLIIDALGRRALMTRQQLCELVHDDIVDLVTTDDDDEHDTERLVGLVLACAWRRLRNVCGVESRRAAREARR